MQTGISQWSVQGGLEGARPIPEVLADAKAAGFAAIELAVAETGVLTPDTDAATLAAYRREADRLGLVLETLASGMSWSNSPTHEDPAIRRRGIDLHKRALRVARDLGCQSLLFVPGAVRIPWDPAYPLVRYDHAVDRARAAVAELAPEAERLGVELCVENVWNGLFYSPLELRDFIDSFASPSVGIYFDVGNLLGYHQHAPHWIEILGRRIRRVHVKDFKASVGTLDGFCDLLEGDVPLRQSIAALRAVGYDRTVIAEMIPHKPGLLEKTAAALRQIVA